MPTPNWLNQNANRSFPFLKDSVGQSDGPLTLTQLPDDIIVDAGFVMGPQSGFTNGEHRVYLNRLYRSGDFFYFEFETDAPYAHEALLTFTRHVDDADRLTEHLNSGQTGTSVSGSTSEQDCDEPLWSGYLVTGSIASLVLLLPVDGAIAREDESAILEPALIQNLAESYVTSIALANDDRTRVTAPDDCDDVVFPYETGVVFVKERCLQGEILLKAGYNAIVRQEAGDNSLTFGAGVGRGEGEPCGELTLFDEEIPPDDSNLLTGGPQCNEVLRSVNGRGGRLFNLIASTGVTITPVPDENRLLIDVDMSGLALCFNSVSHISESDSE